MEATVYTSCLHRTYPTCISFYYVGISHSTFSDPGVAELYKCWTMQHTTRPATDEWLHVLLIRTRSGVVDTIPHSHTTHAVIWSQITCVHVIVSLGPLILQHFSREVEAEGEQEDTKEVTHSRELQPARDRANWTTVTPHYGGQGVGPCSNVVTLT